MARREFLAQLVSSTLAFPLLGLAQNESAQQKKLKIMMKSAWGSDDPTKAAFPFLHGLALSEAGHSVQIFLLGEAVSLMRKTVAEAVVPVGWPPLAETMHKIASRQVAIYACRACSRARGVSEGDLAVGREVRQSADLRVAGGVGGPRDYGVTHKRRMPLKRNGALLAA